MYLPIISEKFSRIFFTTHHQVTDSAAIEIYFEFLIGNHLKFSLTAPRILESSAKLSNILNRSN